MRTILYILSITTIFISLFTGNANAFTVSGKAGVVIIDKSSGIWPEGAKKQNKQLHQQSQPFLSKIFKIQNRTSNRNINGRYVVSSSNRNNVQISLNELAPHKTPIKFKSMKMLRKSTNADVMTLATVVTIPPGIAQGSYNPALQISAHYE